MQRSKSVSFVQRTFAFITFQVFLLTTLVPPTYGSYYIQTPGLDMFGDQPVEFIHGMQGYVQGRSVSEEEAVLIGDGVRSAYREAGVRYLGETFTPENLERALQGFRGVRNALPKSEVAGDGMYATAPTALLDVLQERADKLENSAGGRPPARPIDALEFRLQQIEKDQEIVDKEAELYRIMRNYVGEDEVIPSTDIEELKQEARYDFGMMDFDKLIGGFADENLVVFQCLSRHSPC